MSRFETNCYLRHELSRDNNVHSQLKPWVFLILEHFRKMARSLLLFRSCEEVRETRFKNRWRIEPGVKGLVR
jgi:hypothetical protein